MDTYTQVMLSVIIGVLMAVVYTLRMLVLMDKKMDRIMKHLGIHQMQ